MDSISIEINGRFLRAQVNTGVQNWAHGVLDELKTLSHVELRIITPSRFFSSGIRGHFWEQLILPLRRNRSKYLINLSNFAPILGKRMFLVIHDLMPYSSPNFFPLSYRLAVKFNYFGLSRRDVRLATVSTYSKEQILKYFNLQSDQVAVLGASITLKNFPEIKLSPIAEKIDIQSNLPYFVAYGSANPRKNISFLVGIWLDFNIHSKARLTVLNQTNFLNPESDKATRPGLNITYLSNVDNESMKRIIEKSHGLLWPSHDEGYGLPLLEFMHLGKPFISSSTGAATDLATGNSRVIDLDEKLWKFHIHRLLSLDFEAENHVQKKKASLFTWTTVCDKIINHLLTSVDS